MTRKSSSTATTPSTVKKLRCAVYTRKSSEEGLDMEFNSLDAQRESCEAYIASQRAEGWVLVHDRYDDGGFSGATLERPALKRLLADVERGLVDTVVCYKIDRLSRSLMDFSRLVEVFDRHDVTFVSVTQSFNTTTSMGRLTLNILLSFAQFEREVIGERIRDKFAASRKRGMWMGGTVPLGYDVKDRKLLVNAAEAAVIRRVFEGFARLQSGIRLVEGLRAEGSRTKRGNVITKGDIYKLLNNRIYIGDAVHKGTAYPGEHDAIISKALWDEVRAILDTSPRARANHSRAQTPALLKGLIFGPTGHAMSPTHTRRRGRQYRYYISQAVLKLGRDACPVGRVPAAEIERAVIDQVRAVLRQPEIIVGTWAETRTEADDVTETEVREALERLDPLWDEMFPAEQARIIHLLVERVDIGTAGVDIKLRVDGLAGLAQEFSARSRAAGRGMTTDAQTLTIHVALNIRRRGGRKQIVSPAGSAPWVPSQPQIDSTMVKALARAFRWRKMLETGAVSTVREIAAKEKINSSYVSRVLRLTLLAPEIVEAVLDGRQEPQVTLPALMGVFPVEWGEQRATPRTQTSA